MNIHSNVSLLSRTPNNSNENVKEQEIITAGIFIPKEIILEILSYLDITNLPCIRLVNKQWLDLSQNLIFTIKLSNGFIFKGIFNGKWKGQVNKQGKICEGEFIKGLLNGQGKITFDNKKDLFDYGRVCIGEFKDDQLNGQGMEVKPVGFGLKLELNLEEIRNQLNSLGKINGLRKITFDVKTSDLEASIGEFKEGKLNGPGTKIYANKSIEQGEFKNGRLNGQGALFTKYSIFPTIKEGNFKDGKLMFGKKSEEFCSEEGKFEDDASNHLSHGKRISVRGGIEEGEFKDDRLKSGKKIFDGIVEEGEFKDGRLESGKKIYSNGIVEEGVFGEGLFFSESKFIHGKRIYPDGIVEEGEFEGGKLNAKQ